MDAIQLGVLPAMSHSWHRHEQSMLIVRVAKTLVNGAKALFGSYTVNAVDAVTPRLVCAHKNARFSQALQKPLTLYKVDSLTERLVSPYVANKLRKLIDDKRTVQCRLVFNDDNVSLLPSYRSKEGFAADLNGQVERADKKETIVCRHLAQAYLDGAFGRGKSSFSKLNSHSKLKAFSAHIPNDDTIIESLKNILSDEAYYFSIDSIQDAIKKIAVKYWGMRNGQEKCFYFCTDSHLMALRFKKQKECLKVIFYDPNLTDVHCTYSLSSPSDAHGLTINCLMSRRDSRDYFEKSKTACIRSLSDVKDGQPSVHLFGKLDANVIYSSMMFSHFGYGALSTKDILDMVKGMSYEKKLNLIIARNSVGVTAIQHSVTCRYAHSFISYLDFIDKVGLSSSDFERLLDIGVDLNGVSIFDVLFIGFKRFDLGVQYIKKVLECNSLDLLSKKNILKGFSDGKPLMCKFEIPLSLSDISVDEAMKIIECYAQVIADSHLPYSYKQELLLSVFPKDAQYDLCKRVELSGAFIKAVEKSSLEGRQQQEVIMKVPAIIKTQGAAAGG